MPVVDRKSLPHSGTDLAAETATLTRGQILQQASTAMVAQANATPQLVLQLLR